MIAPALLILGARVNAAALVPAHGQTVTIRGTVVDATTQAPIKDAQVFLVELARSVLTGADGRFEFPDVRPGTHTLGVSRIGYIYIRRRVPIVSGVTLDITVPLAEGTGTYQETVTVAASARLPSLGGVSSQMVLGSAGHAELRGVVADDPLRAVQALPGVATGDDFQAEFSVRGSAYRHVGIVLDGTPTTSLLHAVRGRDDTGSVSMINTDVLSHAGLFAGPHPQRHGDWIGPTLDFELRDGSRDRAGFRAAVSGTSASAVFEGPLAPGKRSSWLVSVRRSYLDWLIRKLDPDSDSTVGFTDAQAKIVYDVTSRHQLQFVAIGGRATYLGTDPPIVNGLERATSNSGFASVSWRYLTPKLVITQRVGVLGNDFDNRGVSFQQLGRGFTQGETARLDVTVPLPDGWTLEAGGRYERVRTNQVLRDFVLGPSNSGLRVREQRDLYAKTRLKTIWGEIGRRGASGSINAGVRITDRSLASETAVSPWIVGERAFGSLTLRGGFGLAAQYPDPMLWGVGAPRVEPEHAQSVDISGEYRLAPTMKIAVTGFHRSEADVLRRVGEDRIDPETGTRIFGSVFPEYSASLDGTARGVDITFTRRGDSGLTGWVAYTWSHTRHHDTITGEDFDADYDQRHTLNIVAAQRLSYRLSLNAKLRVGSNMPLIGYFTGTTENLSLSSSRNQVRLPLYARLDVRANRTFTFDRGRLTLFLEVMNLLGRDNLGQNEGIIRPNREALGYTERLIPFVPSVGFLIEF